MQICIDSPIPALGHTKRQKKKPFSWHKAEVGKIFGITVMMAYLVRSDGVRWGLLRLDSGDALVPGDP